MRKIKIGLLIVLGIVTVMILIVLCGYTVTPWISIQNQVRLQNSKYIGRLTKKDYAKVEYLLVVDMACTPYGRVRDIYNLEKLENLSHLAMVTDNISAINSLENVKNLRSLNLYIEPYADDNPTYNLDSVAHINNLKYFSLTAQKETIDISPLAEHPTLETIHLSIGNEMNLSPLSKHTNLHYLNLHYRDNETNYIFTPMPNIKKLRITCPPHPGNKHKINFTDFTGMINLENFECELTCHSNLDSISNMTNLKTFWLRNGGEINDLTPLINCSNLENLGLDAQQITDLTPLLKLKNLKKLNIQLNPLDEKSIDEILPVLRERGVEIRYAKINSHLTNINS